MQYNHRARSRDASSGHSRGPVQIFESPMDTKEIFRTLIADEVRSGSLSRSRRRRIVQYASHLGLSGVQVGEMIDDCRKEALESDDTVERANALRLVPAHEPRVPTSAKIAIVIGLALLVDFIVLKWLVLP